MPGTLYVVATPIGNLDDLSARVRDTLAAVDAVLAEDTRRSLQLLTHLGVRKPLRRFDAQIEHAGSASIEHVVGEIEAGASFALVSDAGTPMVNDPGEALVRAVVARGGKVVAIPGPSAVLCALAASGLAGGGFRFVGFLPRAGGERAEALARIVDTPEPVVLFEAGNRTRDTIVELAARMPERRAAIARELTKAHEEILRGTLAELAVTLDAALLGEVTIVLGAFAERSAATVDDSAIDARIDAELAAGRRAKDAADVVAAWSGRPRREVYARTVSRKGAREGR